MDKENLPSAPLPVKASPGASSDSMSLDDTGQSNVSIGTPGVASRTPLTSGKKKKKKGLGLRATPANNVSGMALDNGLNFGCSPGPSPSPAKPSKLVLNSTKRKYNLRGKKVSGGREDECCVCALCVVCL